MPQVVLATVRVDDKTDHYELYSYLRDSCVPNIRPLYNYMADHYNDDLKAAALLKYELDSGQSIYELVIWSGYAEVRYRIGIPRKPPTLEQFIEHLQ